MGIIVPYSITTFFMFFLLLISQHEMRRLVLMVNDVNAFTGRHHQYQTIILKRLKSTKVLLMFLLSINS